MSDYLETDPRLLPPPSLEEVAREASEKIRAFQAAAKDTKLFLNGVELEDVKDVTFG